MSGRLTPFENSLVGLAGGALEVSCLQSLNYIKNVAQQGIKPVFSVSVMYRGYPSNVVNMGSYSLRRAHVGLILVVLGCVHACRRSVGGRAGARARGNVLGSLLSIARLLRGFQYLPRFAQGSSLHKSPKFVPCFVSSCAGALLARRFVHHVAVRRVW